jgi:hypothetical protein
MAAATCFQTTATMPATPLKASITSLLTTAFRSAIQWRNRGRHRRRGPGQLATERNLRKRHKTGPQDRSPVPSRLRKARARANFAGFSRECRRSQTAWRREGDLNRRAPSAFGLLKTPRVRPIILRSFSETAHREFIRHRFDTVQTYPGPLNGLFPGSPEGWEHGARTVMRTIWQPAPRASPPQDKRLVIAPFGIAPGQV